MWFSHRFIVGIDFKIDPKLSRTQVNIDPYG